MIGLVGCAAQKLDRPAAAEDLYISPLFRKASAYARATYDAWFILSARYGLLAPTAWIAPYDLALGILSVHERSDWGARVLGQLEALGMAQTPCALHAGHAYRAPLEGRVAMTAPLAGLGIGRQLAWYVERGF